MYSPRLLDDVLEYIELFNDGASKLTLDGFQIRTLFTFPPGSIIQSKSYVVIARNKTEFLKLVRLCVCVFEILIGFSSTLDITQTSIRTLLWAT